MCSSFRILLIESSYALPNDDRVSEPYSEAESDKLFERLRLRQITSPFEGMTREQVDRFIQDFGADHQQQYARGLRQLQHDIGRIEPTSLLASLATSYLFTPEGVDSEIMRHHPVLPFHLEILQALALMRTHSEFGHEFPVPPSLVQQISEGVREVALSWAHAGLTKVAPMATERERKRLFAQTRIRVHTVAIRNWGFPDQMVEIVARLLMPLDDAIEQATGLRATHLLRMQAAIVTLVENRYNDLIQRLSPMYAAQTLEGVVDAYHQEFPSANDDRHTLLAVLQYQGASLHQARMMLLAYRELFFSDLYTLSLDDLIGCYPGNVDRDAVRRVVEGWSLNFGDLAACDPSELFLENPVWTHPFMRLDAETFFCPNPGLLHSFALEMIEEVLSPYPNLVQRYEKRRARFLELEVETLLRRSFPSATIVVGSEWRNDETGRNGENDLTLVLDEYAIVFEAKAGKITSRALRGHPERLAKTIQGLVVGPTVQGRAFADLLRTTPGTHHFETKSRGANTIDSSGIRRYLGVNVTLELFSVLDLRWPVLRDAGFIPENIEPALTLSLVDLDVLLKVLDSEQRRIHYLVRRTDLEACSHILGDEFDLLAYYLKTGFNIGEMEFVEDRGIDLGLQSKLVDRFVQDPASPRLTDWPGTRLAPLWQDLLDELAESRPLGWIEMSVRLLNVSFDEQQRFSDLLDSIASKARRAGNSVAVRTAKFQSGPRRKRQRFIAVAFKGIAPEDAAMRANDLVAQFNGERPEDTSFVVYVRVEDRRRSKLVG